MAKLLLGGTHFTARTMMLIKIPTANNAEDAGGADDASSAYDPAGADNADDNLNVASNNVISIIINTISIIIPKWPYCTNDNFYNLFTDFLTYSGNIVMIFLIH